MANFQRDTIQPQLINVHQVLGDQAAIQYLRNADHEFTEGLFFTAKRYGYTTFMFNGEQYDIRRNHDVSFTVAKSVEQALTTESFS
jgi:hypothetical protein